MTKKGFQKGKKLLQKGWGGGGKKLFQIPYTVYTPALTTPLNSTVQFIKVR